jgi:hypothetical protein
MVQNAQLLSFFRVNDAARRSRWAALLAGLLGWSLVLLLMGCNTPEDPLPTLVSQVVLPSATPTSLPATMDISTRQPVSGVATSGAVEATAVKPTPKPSITPTPVDSLINISAPSDNAVLVLGSPTTVRGLVQRNPSEEVYLSLVSSNGRLLTEQVVMPATLAGRPTLFRRPTSAARPSSGPICVPPMARCCRLTRYRSGWR